MTQKFTAEEVRMEAAGLKAHGYVAGPAMLNAYADTLSKPADSGRVGDDLVAEGLDYFERGGDAGDKLYVEAIRAALAAQGQGEAVEYFAADPADGEFTTYKTLPEAHAAAVVSLGYAQEEAFEGGWEDEPPQICYGIVLGGCVEKEGSRRPAPEGSDFSELVDYRLTEPRAPPASPAGVPDGWSGWCTQMPGRLPKLWGAIEVAELNYYPEDGWRLFKVVEVAAPSAPEGDGGEG